MITPGCQEMAARNNQTHTQCFKYSRGSPESNVVDEGCIIKTMQIEIQDDKSHRGIGDEDSDSRYGNLQSVLRVSNMGDIGLKASSGIEFAVHGA